MCGWGRGRKRWRLSQRIRMHTITSTLLAKAQLSWKSKGSFSRTPGGGGGEGKKKRKKITLLLVPSKANAIATIIISLKKVNTPFQGCFLLYLYEQFHSFCLNVPCLSKINVGFPKQSRLHSFSAQLHELSIVKSNQALTTKAIPRYTSYINMRRKKKKKNFTASNCHRT